MPALVVLIGSGVWCLAIVAAPLFHIQPIYGFFSIICHQIPARSWHLDGAQLPVCIRCACIYLGFFSGALFRIPANSKLLKIAMISTVTEFALSIVLVDSPWLRGSTGLFLGAATAPFVRIGIEEMVRAM